MITVKLLIQAGSQIEAESPIQAGGSRTFVLIEAGGLYYKFYGIRPISYFNFFLNVIKLFDQVSCAEQLSNMLLRLLKK